MTMRVIIKNDDATRTAKLSLRSIPLGSDFKPTGEEPRVTSVIEIAPKGERDLYLHSGQDCVLSEV